MVQDLNVMMKDYMDGLSVKVFRTYNASVTLDALLWEHSNSTEMVEKQADYNRANKEVCSALSCPAYPHRVVCLKDATVAKERARCRRADGPGWRTGGGAVQPSARGAQDAREEHAKDV